jgi:hypothetical protein
VDRGQGLSSQHNHKHKHKHKTNKNTNTNTILLTAVGAQHRRTKNTTGNLTAQRWYPTALNLPNGEVWVPGGTWAQKPNGTWPKAEGADIHNPAEETVRRVPLNARLFGAGLGNWYMGSRVLPSGKVATMNMVRSGLRRGPP